MHLSPHAFVCARVDAALGAEVGALLGLAEGLDVGFFLVGAKVGARLGLPEGLDVGFFLDGEKVGARLGLPEGLDVGFFLFGAKVGARLVGLLEKRFGGVGFLVGLVVTVSLDCFNLRSSVVDRAPQTAVITVSDRQMWKVIMTTFA